MKSPKKKKLTKKIVDAEKKLKTKFKAKINEFSKKLGAKENPDTRAMH